MHLSFLDWSIIAGYFAVSLAIGVFYSRRAGKDVGEFFLSGRNLPWWLAGTSMVATTFAADTPLAVAGLVAPNGVAGHWIWWKEREMTQAGIAQLARARAFQARGRGFESRFPLQFAYSGYEKAKGRSMLENVAGC